MFLGPRSHFQSKEFFKLLVIFFSTNVPQTLTVDSPLHFSFWGEGIEKVREEVVEKLQPICHPGVA